MKSSVDRRRFTIHVNDVHEQELQLSACPMIWIKMWKAAMLTAVFDIGDISFDSELSNNCQQNKTDFDVSNRPSCFLSGLLT